MSCICVTFFLVKKSVETKLAGAVIKDSPVEGNRALYVSVLGPGKNFWSSGLQHKDHVFEKGKKYTLAAFFEDKKRNNENKFQTEISAGSFYEDGRWEIRYD